MMRYPVPRITISGGVYEALKAEKRAEESFSDMILRLLPGGDPHRILAYIRTHEPIDEETAASIRKVSEDMRRNFKVRVPRL
jgi:predicted CopG family antitoxin